MVENRSRPLIGLAAVVLTWCLLTPALVIVVAAPAQAANTASEWLVDPADRTTLATADGVRAFGGANRYQTAVRLAERYAYERGGLDSVPTVILASGNTPIDGAVAAGLSARNEAPILLTPPKQLHRGVANYIEDHQVSAVIILGGPASVSKAVLDEVAALKPEPTVRRIVGGDRFATAAAIASELDAVSNLCGTNDTVALLANASDERIGEVVATGPLAYAKELPVLLTNQSVVPRATIDALQRLRIDRVVIVGDTTVVSDDVIGQLVAAGVNETQRIAASSPEAVSAAVARLMTETCDLELGTARYLVALAGTDSVIDAVAAAPLLGLGLDGSGPVPLLFVGSRLNASVSSFLRTTRSTVDNVKTHVELVAIGGTSAISDAAMQLAIRTATTSRPLTGRISAVAGENTFRISFTEALLIEGEHFEGRMRDLLYLNDAPALIDRQVLTSSRPADACDAVTSLTVTLRHPLQAGDVIEMRSTDSWFAVNEDRRPLRGARYTVPAPSIRTPVLEMEIIASAGRSELVFAVEYDPAESDGTDTSVDPNRIRILPNREVEVDVGEPEFVGAERFLGLAFHRLPLTAPQGYAGDSSSDPIAQGGAYELAVDDFVDLRGGAVNGPDSLRSRRLRARVTVPEATFGISAVRIGLANPGVDDRAATTTPDTIPDVSERAQVTLGNSVHLVGKWTGSAAGAAGNGWLLDSARASARVGESASAVSATNHAAIRVWIDTSNRVILLRFIDSEEGEPPELTYGAFVRALSSNAAFTRHFLAELVNGCIDESEPLSLDDDGGIVGIPTLAGGVSSVSFLVEFTDYINEFIIDDESDVATVAGATGVVELIDDILGALIPDYGEAADDAPTLPTPDRVETTTVLPNDTVLFRFTTADPQHTIGQIVSIRRNRIEIAAGIARGQTPDNPDTADVDESLNPAKTLFGVSSRDALLRTALPAASSSQ